MLKCLYDSVNWTDDIWCCVGWCVQDCLRQCQEQIEQSLRNSVTGSSSSSTSDHQQQPAASKHRSEASAQPSTPTDVREVVIDDQWWYNRHVTTCLHRQGRELWRRVGVRVSLDLDVVGWAICNVGASFSKDYSSTCRPNRNWRAAVRCASRRGKVLLMCYFRLSVKPLYNWEENVSCSRKIEKAD